jgi:hypothetical protein
MTRLTSITVGCSSTIASSSPVVPGGGAAVPVGAGIPGGGAGFGFATDSKRLAGLREPAVHPRHL